MKFWDTEGNEFTVAGSKAPDRLILRGVDGDKEISVFDLKDYRAYPPEEWEAMEAIVKALKNGDITVPELRKMMGKDE